MRLGGSGRVSARAPDAARQSASAGMANDEPAFCTSRGALHRPADGPLPPSDRSRARYPPLRNGAGDHAKRGGGRSHASLAKLAAPAAFRASLPDDAGGGAGGVMSDAVAPALTRRALLERIGAAAGGAALLEAMRSLGFAAESPYRGPIELEGDPKGASVLVLGAGLAGMTAAYELGRAGYKVRVLEYNNRPGGRNWTIRGGDVYTELGGATQACAFDPGLYLNPGPVADPLPPPRDPRLLPQVRRRARALHPAQPQRLFALGERVRRQAAAHPRGQGRFRRRRLRASRQGGEEGRARRRDLEGGPGNPARGAARARRARQGFSLPGRRRLRLAIAAMPKDPGGGLERGACRRRADRQCTTS